MADDDFIKRAQFRAFEAQKRLENAIPNPECPICKNRRWFLETDGRGLLSSPSPEFISKDPRGFWGPAPSIPTVVYSCGNCGFVRQHNIAVLTPDSQEGDDG